MKSTATGFGSVARILHWLSALLVIVLIVTGFRAGWSEEAATKVAALRIHMPLAIALLVLTLARLIWWWRFDRKPNALEGLPAWQDQIGRWTHRGLYALILLLLVSGVAMSILSGLPAALFEGAPFPVLAELPPRAAHGIAARVIAGLVMLHSAAALYHHFVRKDRTLLRMLKG